MSDTLKIFHNPRCSKCRQTMQIIDGKEVSVEVVEYLNSPPDAGELESILQMLRMEPRDLMRRHEAPYKELNLDDENLSREALIQAMIEHPILIERPIVIRGNRAVVARPPENVLDLF